MNRRYKFSAGSLANIKTLSKPLQTVCFEGLEIANTRKLHCPDFSIVSGVRSKEEQFQLYQIGRFLDQEGKWKVIDESAIVTNCDGEILISDHQRTDEFGLGMAFDYACWVNSSNYEAGNMSLVATCFFEAASNNGIVIDWGGNYRSISDGSHISLIV